VTHLRREKEKSIRKEIVIQSLAAASKEGKAGNAHDENYFKDKKVALCSTVEK